MRKWEFVVTIIVAIFLGGGIALVFNSFSGSDEVNSLEVTDSPTTVYTAEFSPNSIPEISTATPESSKENNINASPTLNPIGVGEEKPPDVEDLLLLYSSENFGPLDFNYCQVAEFYGLVCKKVDVLNTEITDQLLQDSSGAYYKLIGIDASILQQVPVLLSRDEIENLRNAIEIHRSNLLIYNLNERTVGSNLIGLTDSNLISVTVPKDNRRDWHVSTASAEITQEFTGQSISSSSSAAQIDFALRFNPKATITPLILSKDDAGDDYLIFARLFQGSGSIFLNAGAPGWGLNTRSFLDIYYNSSHFSEIIPLMLTIRYTLGEEAWHNNQAYANLTLAAPLLIEPDQKLNFAGLLREMESYNFHTSIALPPVNWDSSKSDVTNLFIENPDRYSLVQNGNNADGYEFYKYSVAPDDPIPARPFADQEWDILEGISRMTLFTEYTGIPFERVMVFPAGISPEETLVLLKKQNYLASVNKENIPLGATTIVNDDEGMAPVSLQYGNFPLLIHRLVDVTQSSQSNVQPLLFDLFIGKPALIVSEINENGVFANGIDAFDPIADQINEISGDVEWLSLADIIKRLYLEKVNDDGSADIRMYTNDLILKNNSRIKRTFHVSKEENLNVPIMSLTVNGQELAYRLEGGFLNFDIVLPAQNSSEFIIQYQSK